MSLSPALSRAQGQCELCGSQSLLTDFLLDNSDGYSADDATVALCDTCREQLAAEPLDGKYWLCLQTSAWSPYAPVQVLAYRLLNRLTEESWAADLLDAMFMEDDTREWAQQGISQEPEVVTRDCNGAVLSAGDSVVIVKDLDVKGTSFVAKRGTAVRNIGLTDNPEHIEGRVNGTRIVLLTLFVKKSN